jgi:putative ABC transport system permease protein
MPGVPRPIAAVLRRVVPARLAAGVIADLEDDYRRERITRRPLTVAVWLGREVASLVGAFAVQRMRDAGRGGPRVLRDARLAWRGLRQTPLVTVSAAATLSVGVLAVLLAAGLGRTLLLRPVSDLHDEALRRVAVVDRSGRSAYRLSHLEIEQIREQVRGSAGHAAVNLQPAVLRIHGADVQTMVEVVDGGYFDLIGAPLVLGRALGATDDQAAAPPVAVISEALWRRRFGASPAVVGHTVAINRAAFTVVGVIAAAGSASALGAGVDAWTPLAHGDAVLNPGWRTDPSARWFSMFVLPATSIAGLDAALARAAGELTTRDPEGWRDRALRSAPGTVLTGGQRDAAASVVGILGGLALLILAAAAANVAGVLVARASASMRHTAIHLALGAGRAAIARRLMFEGALLGTAAGGLALLLYVWARRQIAEVALLPTLTLRLDLPLDAGLALAVVAAAAATGAALAVGPAAWAIRVDPSGVSSAGVQRAVGGASVSATRRLLVAAQTGVSVMMVVGAVLFSRSLAALAAEDLGFPRAGLVALDFDLAPAVLPSASAALAREALARIARLPGVTATAMANRAPVDRSLPAVEVRLTPSGPAAGDTTLSLATEDYFSTVGIPLLAGRAFSRQESDRGDGVAIVNETLARRLWPDGAAVGRALVVGPGTETLRVVGVARDAKYRAITDSGARHLYRPTPAGFSMTLLVRTAGEPRRALADVQQVLDGVGPGVVGFFPRTIDDHLAAEVLPARVAATAATALGGIGLALTGVGLYGLVAWLVERRRREIGVRLALGASPASVVRLVVFQAARAAAPGIAGGALLALAMGWTLRTRLFGVGPLDPWAFVIAAGALAVVVVLAAWAPGARAAKTDPVSALRAE